jgi:Arc/MetJ-type ribon-helix-helix transcriptional regulator
MPNISANVSDEFSRKLHVAAAERGWSKSEAIREAVRLWLMEQSAAVVLADIVFAIEDEHLPAFRESILSADDVRLLERAHEVLGND